MSANQQVVSGHPSRMQHRRDNAKIRIFKGSFFFFCFSGGDSITDDGRSCISPQSPNRNPTRHESKLVSSLPSFCNGKNIIELDAWAEARDAIEIERSQLIEVVLRYVGRVLNIGLNASVSDDIERMIG